MSSPAWMEDGWAALQSCSLMGPRVQGMERPELQESRDLYRYLARSILYQQLSGKAAATIERRMIALWPGEEHPSPAQLAEATVEDLRAVGVSRPKAAYLIDLATQVRDGRLPLDHLWEEDDDAVRAHVTQVKGVGVWTADMVLIFAMNRPDILPLGDLGVRNGFMKLMNSEEPLKPKEMEQIGERWRPHRTLASLVLWRLADGA